MRVAVVGATGAVGQEMIKTLEKRNFPVTELFPLASSRSLGRKASFKDKQYDIIELNKNSIPEVDVALFSAGASISKEFARLFTQKGAYVIDNSSAFRMEKDIPLIIPEVNEDVLTQEAKLIANPNCSTIQMVVVLDPIHKKYGIKRIIVSTYQSVSGAGAKAMEELTVQSKAYLEGSRMPGSVKFAHRIAFNCLPHIDVFLENGYTKEEMKMVNETRKIMRDDKIQVSATCVRVPVFRAHSEAVWIETKKKISVEDVKNLLSGSKGVEVVDNVKENKYPLPIYAENQYTTYVGRIRQDISVKNGVTLWIVSDNLLKGAALNAVQIAESLLKKGLF